MADTIQTRKSRGKKKSKATMNEELSLEFIQDLGGTKDDLRLLADLDDGTDDDDLLLPAHDFDAEPIKKEEVYNFMKDLGLSDREPDEGKAEKKKPKKLLTAPELEDDGDDDAHTAPPTSPDDLQAPQLQRPKKEKNKFKAATHAADHSDHSPKEKKTKEKKKEKEEKTKEKKTKEKKMKEEKKTKEKKTKQPQIQHSEVSSTSAGGEGELRAHLQSAPQRSHLLLKPGHPWTDAQGETGAEETTGSLVLQCEQFAVKLLQDEVALYKTQREKTKRGESQWIRTVLTSGTLSDKMAALMVLVQESTPHNMAAIDTLVAMANKKGKREAMLAADTLKNLFVSESSPLPDDRKLIAFDTRAFSSLWHACSGNRESVDRRLVAWHGEDLLRHKYAAFIKALDVMSYDTLATCKEKALTIIHSLLTAKPEQENVLLSMLVNKLGDPNHKIASKASYLLLKLVEEHPNMKGVIVAEVERLVYRSNITQRAQYYALCLLNQVRLQKSDHALASRLIAVYFTFFQVSVKKGEADSKMMAALLTGVNRAYPYAKVKQDSLLEQTATLYKIVHIVNFNTSVQALMLLLHVVDPSSSDSDRFFMALYRKLMDPALRSSARQAQFLNLLYRSMKADIIDNRVMAFMKRLLQTGALLGPNFLCGALIIISEILKERPNLLRIKQMGKSSMEADLGWEDDDEEERFVDLPPPPEFHDGYLNQQPSGATEGCQEDTQPQEAGQGHTEPRDSKGHTDPQQDSKGHTHTHTASGSWLHRKNLTDQRGYDCYQRNPLHCHAQHECLWELRALTRHFHPSVSLFANTLLQGEAIEYSSDPLQDFTLIRFLDRFVYKNPKKREAVGEHSQTVGSASGKRQQSSASVPVTSSEFLQGGEDAVPEHERYLYRYFSQRAQDKKKKEEADADSDASSVSDTEFDQFLDKHERQLDHDDLDGVDFGLDFAGSMEKKMKGSKGKGSKADSSDDDDDDDDDGDLSDEEIDFGDDEDDELAAEFRREMEEMGEREGGEDEEFEDEEFSGDELKQMMGSSKKRASQDEPDIGKPQKKRRKGDLASMFAAADDFADLLESTADTGLTSSGTGDAVLINDKASAKQIAWESKREQSWRGKSRGEGKGHGRDRKGHGRDRKGHGGKFFRGGRQHKRKM